MVRVVAHIGLDMLRARTPTSWPEDFSLNPNTSDSRFIINYSVFEGTYSGKNLTYAGDMVTGGTLTGLDITLIARLTYIQDLDIYDMNVDARQAAVLIRAGDFPAFLALALTGNDMIQGSSADDVLLGYGGDDALVGGLGKNRVDGGAGFDRAQYFQTIDRFAVHNDGQTISVSAHDGTITDTLVNIERVQFANAFLAFDFAGAAGQAYRMYQAAFDRTPDALGLSYWIRAMDEGMQLLDVSRHFIASAEFKAAYGGAPSNADFVDRLYDNILGREGEAEGVNFWTGQLNVGMPREWVLLHFSESPENTVGTAPTINNGILFYAT